MTDATGNLVSQTKYKAWGQVRYTSGTNPSNYTFTGQYSYTQDFGLMYYNARWYDPSLGRFAQADSIIPLGVQGLDRYAYVNNSPMNYVDPSGHCAIDDEADECFVPGKTKLPKDTISRTEETDKLITLAKEVGRTPMEVIRLAIAHEISGWAYDPTAVDLYGEHLRNRYTQYAKDNCGGDFGSNNCFMNFFTSNFETLQNFIESYTDSGSYGLFTFREDENWSQTYKDASAAAFEGFWVKLNPSYSYGVSEYGGEAYVTGIMNGSDWFQAFGVNKVAEEQYKQFVLYQSTTYCNGHQVISAIFSGDGAQYIGTLGLEVTTYCK